MDYEKEKEILVDIMDYTIQNYFSKLSNLISGFNMSVKGILSFDRQRYENEFLGEFEGNYYQETIHVIRDDTFKKIELVIRDLNVSLKNTIDVYNSLTFIQSLRNSPEKTNSEKLLGEQVQDKNNEKY